LPRHPAVAGSCSCPSQSACSNGSLEQIGILQSSEDRYDAHCEGKTEEADPFNQAEIEMANLSLSPTSACLRLPDSGFRLASPGLLALGSLALPIKVYLALRAEALIVVSILGI
jgi:hypothetical protein